MKTHLLSLLKQINGMSTTFQHMEMLDQHAQDKIDAYRKLTAVVPSPDLMMIQSNLMVDATPQHKPTLTSLVMNGHINVELQSSLPQSPLSLSVLI